MKTSNKILIALGSTIVVLVIALVISIRLYLNDVLDKVIKDSYAQAGPPAAAALQQVVHVPADR